MPAPETDYQWHNINIYISEIRILLKPYSQKLGYILIKTDILIKTVVYTVNSNVLEFINIMTSNKHKLLSLSNLPLLSYQPLPVF